MDDLIVAVVQQTNERRMTRLNQAMQSSEPLKSLWKLNSDLSNATMTSELVWLAPHRPATRTEIVRSAKAFRARQIKEIAQVLEANNVDQKVYPAAALAAMMVALGRTFVTDMRLGLSRGYPEAVQVMEGTLNQLSRKADAAIKTKRVQRNK